MGRELSKAFSREKGVGGGFFDWKTFQMMDKKCSPPKKIKIARSTEKEIYCWRQSLDLLLQKAKTVSISHLFLVASSFLSFFVLFLVGGYFVSYTFCFAFFLLLFPTVTTMRSLCLFILFVLSLSACVRAQTQAYKADALVDSIGVNTHYSHTDTIYF